MESVTDPRRVARAFAYAADGYEAHAALQREVAERLDAHLNFTKIAPRRVLDIGCGTGFLSLLLRRRFPEAALWALDLAPAMAVRCRAALGRRLPWQPRRGVLCGDAMALPLASGSFDLVASSLTMQWLGDPEAMLREMRRVLAPGGLLLFSTFGRETLRELRATLRTIDAAKAGLVLPFPDVMSLGDLLQRQAVALPVTDSDRLTLRYADTTALVRELKGMGASARAIRHRRGGLGGRRLLRQLAEHYPVDDDGGITATFEVLYGQAWHRPDPGSDPGVIPIRPAI